MAQRDLLTPGLEVTTSTGISSQVVTRIVTCARGVLRSKKVFGGDPDVYRLERWLESSEEDLLPMKRSADLLFGSGRYQCLGRSLALMALRKILSTLLFRYDLTLVDPTKPWKPAATNGTFMQSKMFTYENRAAREKYATE
ncbi:hypothetical protein MMC22_009353 [Lobaria immixta]|nr:hypothetical protein [Lobaria immixta]